MIRKCINNLDKWKNLVGRKPLVLRGARQVGKSYLIREFAKTNFENFLELNFEKDSTLASLFYSKDPKKILNLLEIHFKTQLDPEKTLLFLDEIQATPEIFETLRYFYEEMPALAVIAAGSLLDFTLREHTFSMPVGRIEYMHLGPMSFEEFLIAAEEVKLHEFLCNFSMQEKIPEVIHKKCMELLRTFLVVGGMPESIQTYFNTHSIQACEKVKQNLLFTYEDDFNKYSKRVDIRRIQKIYRKLPLLVGKKFKYVAIDPEERSKDLAQALELLCNARVVYRVFHTTGAGVPLGALINEKIFKPLFLDIGLMLSRNGLSLLDLEKTSDILLVNNGAVCEQFIGQSLLFLQDFYQEPTLFYWVREQKTSSAEVDYIISEGSHVIPIEVKSGKTGTLKSLHLFLREKKCALGVRFNSDHPSYLKAQTALSDGKNLSYELLSLPLYLVGQTKRLISELIYKSK